MCLICMKKSAITSGTTQYKEENSSLCQNCSDVSLAMGLPTSSGFIKLEKKH